MNFPKPHTPDPKPHFVLPRSRPPQLRGHGGSHHEERHATWLELFYDLIFVAAVAQLASALSDDYSWEGVLRLVALFVPVWWAWIGHTFYLTRFDTDDLWHRLLTMLQMIFVASLAVHAPRGLGEYSIHFALSYFGVRAILVGQYLRAGKHVEAARPLTRRYATGFGVAAFLWLLSTVVPVPLRFALWFVAIAIDILTPLTAGQMHAKIPPHFSHLPERFGLFTIIVLGEAVVAVVQGIGKTGLHLQAGISAVMGMLIAFTFWWGYFDGVHAAEARPVRSRQDVWCYQIWLYTHLPLTMSIVATAIGVKHILALQPSTQLPTHEGWILCGAVALGMTCLTIIYRRSPSISHGPGIGRYLLPHHIVALLTLLCGALTPFVAPVVLILLVALLGASQIVLTFRPRE
jgi:low temperature requirement protein LtrA